MEPSARSQFPPKRAYTGHQDQTKKDAGSVPLTPPASANDKFLVTPRGTTSSELLLPGPWSRGPRLAVTARLGLRGAYPAKESKGGQEDERPLFGSRSRPPVPAISTHTRASKACRMAAAPLLFLAMMHGRRAVAVGSVPGPKATGPYQRSIGPLLKTMRTTPKANVRKKRIRKRGNYISYAWGASSVRCSGGAVVWGPNSRTDRGVSLQRPCRLLFRTEEALFSRCRNCITDEAGAQAKGWDI